MNGQESLLTTVAIGIHVYLYGYPDITNAQKNS